MRIITDTDDFLEMKVGELFSMAALNTDSSDESELLRVQAIRTIRGELAYICFSTTKTYRGCVVTFSIS